MRILLISALSLALVPAGCASRNAPSKQSSEPSGITVESAMEQVSNGLQKMVSRRIEAEQAGLYEQLGLYPSEVTIVFNVTGSSVKENKLFVDMTVAPPLPAVSGGRVGAETMVGETASRGNQITIRFQNMLFSTKDTLIGSIDPQELHRLRYALTGRDPGPRDPTAYGEAPVRSQASDVPMQRAQPRLLGDLPPISPAARDEGAPAADLSSTPAVRDIVRQQQNKTPKPPSTQAGTVRDEN